LDYIAVEIVLGVVGGMGGDYIQTRKRIVVLSGGPAAPGIVGVEKGELEPQDGGLQLVGAHVVADQSVFVLAHVAVMAKQLHTLEGSLVFGGDEAGFTEGPEVLGEVEAESGGVGEAAGFAAFVGRAVGLGSVFDDLESVLAGDAEDGVHVGGLAVDVHRYDGRGLAGDSGFDPVRVDTVGLGVDVHHDGNAAGVNDGLDGGEEGVGWDDDLEAGLEGKSLEGERDGVGAGGTGQAVIGLTVLGEFGFEGLDVITEEEAHLVEDGFEALEELFLDGEVGGSEVDQWHAGCVLVLGHVRGFSGGR